MSTAHFQDLPVVAIEAEAAHAAAITLKVPADQCDAFQFEPGQFITVRATIQGQDVRRSYSLCSTPAELTRHGLIRIGVRAVEGGLMSNWLTQQLQVGQTLSVATPDGRFVIKRPRALHRVGFAAGSGITPILSLITALLEREQQSRATLVYANRRTASTMFKEELEDLKNRFMTRLSLHMIFSRATSAGPTRFGSRSFSTHTPSMRLRTITSFSCGSTWMSLLPCLMARPRMELASLMMGASSEALIRSCLVSLTSADESAASCSSRTTATRSSPTSSGTPSSASSRPPASSPGPSASARRCSGAWSSSSRSTTCW